jgi:hypothetical protein
MEQESFPHVATHLADDSLIGAGPFAPLFKSDADQF